MKVTKKAKPVTLKYKEVLQPIMIYMYTCPTCGTSFEFHGGSIFISQVTNFRCECGQELSVSKNFIEIP